MKRAYVQYERLPDALSKNIYLTALHDRNEVLFYRLFSEHLREMIPIVNDVTVGMAMKQYRHECRPPRGVYLSIDHPQAIEEAFANLGVGPDDVDLILATDAEQILGIGDWGAGGIEVSIGKLAIYTAAGGVDPTRVIPVMLDVNFEPGEPAAEESHLYRESAPSNPRRALRHFHRRVRRSRHQIVPQSVAAMGRLLTGQRAAHSGKIPWPDLHLQRRHTGHWRHHLGRGDFCCSRLRNAPAASQRVVIFGAGTAGVGVADKMRNAMIREGLSKEDACKRFWLVDRQGLLTSAMEETLHDYQIPYARPVLEGKTWKHEDDAITLAEVVHRVKPTMLIGASTVAGSFTEQIVKEMAAHTERPIIFTALSNPPTPGGSRTRRLECLDGWTRTDRHGQPVSSSFL